MLNSTSEKQGRLDTRSIRKVLQQQAHNIVIPQSQEVNVGPDEEYGQLFHRVQLRTFDDLQALSLVPEGLNEDNVRQAMALDDAEALNQARNHLHTTLRTCSCQGGQTGQSSWKYHFRSDLRTTYNGIRRTYHLHLSQLLSDHYQKTVEWDSLLAMSVWGWTKHVTDFAPSVLVLLAADITINRDATMNLSTTAKVLLANDIRIHVGGRLIINSSFIKIRCASAQGDLP